MSAWLCSNDHIYEIAKFYVNECPNQLKVKGTQKLSWIDLSKLFYEENCLSLQERYGDKVTKMRVNKSYKPVVDNLHHMAKLVDCYDYQSSEHKEWKTSRALAMLNIIRKLIVSKINCHIDDLIKHDDYIAAPWGFEYDEYVKYFKKA